MDEDVAWLERGWVWLAGHAKHPQHDDMEARWMQRLRWYEQAMTLVGGSQARGWRYREAR